MELEFEIAMFLIQIQFFQDYAVVCEMPAAEFQKTCKDLAMFSDSLNITATKVQWK